MLIPYTRVETPGEVKINTVSHEAEPGLTGREIRGTAREGGIVAVAALAAILLNSSTTDGTGIDDLIDSFLGLNRAQLASVRAT